MNLELSLLNSVDNVIAVQRAAPHVSSVTQHDATPHVRVPLAGGARIVEALFVARPNRFVIEARLPNGETMLAHCADRGRLIWLRPGLPLLLGVRNEPDRKTGFQVAAAWNENGWASLDTHLPNRLIERALHEHALSPLTGYTSIRREVRSGSSRFDFQLSDRDREWYVEVKSVGCARNGVALFPDAPTERGRKHLHELAALAQGGTRAVLLFVAAHAQTRVVQPDREIDPAFADALVEAVQAGVEVYAYRCPIDRSGMRLEEQIAWRL